VSAGVRDRAVLERKKALKIDEKRPFEGVLVPKTPLKSTKTRHFRGSMFTDEYIG
jgi:hypothetical protein